MVEPGELDLAAAAAATATAHENASLIRAVEAGDVHAAELLLLSSGANPSVSGVGGRAPLHLACSRSDEPVVRLLCGRGAQLEAEAEVRREQC